MKPITNRQPDFDQFLKSLKREGRPTHLPFYEHVASEGFVANRMGEVAPWGTDDYWRSMVDFWLGLGYDCIPMEVPLNCPMPEGHGGTSEQSEAHVVIRTWEDFEKYPWPDEATPLNFHAFELVAKLLPDGAKIVGGVSMGPYEWMSQMMGTVGLSYALADEPELVDAVAAKLGSLIVSACRQLASMEGIGALRQGDDLGFKTATFLSPPALRKLIFPTYTKHGGRRARWVCPSFCIPAATWGQSITTSSTFARSTPSIPSRTPFSRSRSSNSGTEPASRHWAGWMWTSSAAAAKDEIRAYARKAIEDCFHDGYWTLGTGNSLTDYMPVENYLTVLEVGLEVR